MLEFEKVLICRQLQLKLGRLINSGVHMVGGIAIITDV